MSDRICNICGDCLDDLENEDEIEKLNCGHEYCYECILGWFQQLLKDTKKKGGESFYLKKNQCPTCSKKSEYLRQRNGEKFIVDIHGPKPKPPLLKKKKKIHVKSKKSSSSQTASTLICNATLGWGGICTNKGKEEYGHYCGIHKKWATTHPKTSSNTNVSSSSNTNATKCWAKLKKGKAHCKNKAKEEYGYYCGVHKHLATTHPKTSPISFTNYGLN